MTGSSADEEERVTQLVVELGAMIANSWPLVRTEEIREFIRDNAHVGDFRSLAATLILLAEADVGRVGEA